MEKQPLTYLMNEIIDKEINDRMHTINFHLLISMGWLWIYVWVCEPIFGRTPKFVLSIKSIRPYTMEIGYF